RRLARLVSDCKCSPVRAEPRRDDRLPPHRDRIAELLPGGRIPERDAAAYSDRKRLPVGAERSAEEAPLRREREWKPETPIARDVPDHRAAVLARREDRPSVRGEDGGEH